MASNFSGIAGSEARTWPSNGRPSHVIWARFSTKACAVHETAVRNAESLKGKRRLRAKEELYVSCQDVSRHLDRPFRFTQRMHEKIEETQIYVEWNLYFATYPAHREFGDVNGAVIHFWARDCTGDPCHCFEVGKRS